MRRLLEMCFAHLRDWLQFVVVLGLSLSLPYLLFLKLSALVAEMS
jgi:hypothetical protein